jgi:putative ABC transport system substrate-binding protein
MPGRRKDSWDPGSWAARRSRLLRCLEQARFIGYGVNILGLYRRTAYFVDRILKGVKPADLPIEQPTKFELIVNLKTAKGLGLAISETFLVRADGVIE